MKIKDGERIPDLIVWSESDGKNIVNNFCTKPFHIPIKSVIFTYQLINKYMDNKKSASNGIGLGTVLFLIFLVLKLAGIGQVANWSWWWVTSPLWIPILLVIAILGIIVFVTVISNKL